MAGATRATGAIGCRSHSGWAVVVAVAGPPAAPVVLARRRADLLDGILPAQPYHAASEAGLGQPEATELIGKVEELAATRAEAVLGEMATSMQAAGTSVPSVAVVSRDRALPEDLGRILASHPLLHAAEGDLYEQALSEGARRAGLAVIRVEPAAIPVFPGLVAVARTVGPPWQKDHKMAAAAALSALLPGRV
jgi:hypothetical protein